MNSLPEALICRMLLLRVYCLASVSFLVALSVADLEFYRNPLDACHSICYCAHVCLHRVSLASVGSQTSLSSRTGWRHRPRLFMIIACVVLYSMSVWHWAITVNDMIVLSSLSSGILSAGSNYIDYIATQGSNFTSCSDFQSFDKDVDDGIVGILLETTQSKACAAITPLLISVSTRQRSI